MPGSTGGSKCQYPYTLLREGFGSLDRARRTTSNHRDHRVPCPLATRMLGSQTVGDLPLPVVYMQWYASMSQNESVQRLLERYVLLHRMSKEVSFDRYVYTTRSFLMIVAEIGAKVIKKNVAVIERPKAVFLFEQLGLWPVFLISLYS